jgi:drug/metabolite transporter (DMT)-like permease
MFFASALFLLPVCLISGSLNNFVLVNKNNWNLVGLAIISTLIPYYLFYQGIKHVGVAKTASYKLLIPVFTAIFAWLILSENFTNYTIIGMILTICGLFLINRTYLINN